MTSYIKARWWFQTFFYFRPRKLGKIFPIWRAYFCTLWVGKKPPTRRAWKKILKIMDPVTWMALGISWKVFGSFLAKKSTWGRLRCRLRRIEEKKKRRCDGKTWSGKSCIGYPSRDCSFVCSFVLTFRLDPRWRWVFWDFAANRVELNFRYEVVAMSLPPFLSGWW